MTTSASRTEPLNREERQRLAFAVGGWGVRPCSNREGPEPDLTCERIDCRVWYRQGVDAARHDREETLYTVCDELPLTADDVLRWLKDQGRQIQIGGGHPGAMWQVRVSRPGAGREDHVLFSRSRNCLRLEDAILMAGLAVLDGETP